MKKTRRTVQLGFLALTLVAVFALKENAERWCPFGGVEALYTYVTEGNMVCSLGTSNFFLLGGVLAMTLLVRRAFCGYMCPIGTISEMVRSLARRAGLPEIRVGQRVDRVLGAAKYAVLGLILYTTWRAGELMFRGYDPCYALISRHGADITVWAYVVAGAIVAVSLFVSLPFCRWFCPLAAVLTPFSRVGLTRVRRDPALCTGCRRCSAACPMEIPVDQLTQVSRASCLSCLNCVEACPHREKHAITWGAAGWLGRRWPQAALVGVVLVCTTGAVWGSYALPLPSFRKTRGTAVAEYATVDLKVEHLTCRGRANLFVWYLDRDDLFRVPGYLKIEAWPSPSVADVRISYDPRETNVATIQQAITEPYYNLSEDRWLPSPFRIEGYDPLELGLEEAGAPPVDP